MVRLKLFMLCAFTSLSITARLLSQDTLDIIENGKLEVEFISNNLEEALQHARWKLLLSSFLVKFKEVRDQIPEYDNYLIIYEGENKIRVNEVLSTRNDSKDAVVNKAELTNSFDKIIIHFEDLNRLSEIDYERMIDQVIWNWSLGRVKVRSSYIDTIKPKDSQAGRFKTLISTKQHRSIKGVMVIGARIGILRNRPIYEYGLGAGITFGEKRKDLYFFLSGIYQYLEEFDQNVSAPILSLHFRPSPKYSINIGALLRRSIFDIELANAAIRYGITVYPVKGISISPVFYSKSHTALQIKHYGINIGYGI